MSLDGGDLRFVGKFNPARGSMLVLLRLVTLLLELSLCDDVF